MDSKNNQLGRFYGIGTGPGDPGLLTLKAAERLRHVDVIFAAAARGKKSFAGGVIDALGDCSAKRVSLPFTMAQTMTDREQQWISNAKTIVKELKKGCDCAFATIGDPLLYSTYSYLLREIIALLPEVEVETIPGIMAFQDLASRFNLPTIEDRESLLITPAWGRDHNFSAKLKQADTLVLMKTSTSRPELMCELEKAGFAGEFLYGAQLGQKREDLRRGAAAIAEAPDEYLSLIIAKRKSERRPVKNAENEVVKDE
ncbi:MAG: precorrin-2 C(20)-methyltransferase [Deltaproteobacteria bacterium]|nr:precorrin-2 C(20)-methyltransferase [Candidatus Tharpella sp.]